MFKITRSKSLPGLMSTSESSNTWLTPTKDDDTIDVSSINKVRVIKGVDGNGNKVDDISVVDANKTGKSKDLV